MAAATAALTRSATKVVVAASNRMPTNSVLAVTWRRTTPRKSNIQFSETLQERIPDCRYSASRAITSEYRLKRFFAVSLRPGQPRPASWSKRRAYRAASASSAVSSNPKSNWNDASSSLRKMYCRLSARVMATSIRERNRPPTITPLSGSPLTVRGPRTGLVTVHSSL